MRNGSSPCMCNVGQLKPFIRTVKDIWAWMRYRMRNAEAIKKHWCLVFVAYSFLHLDCLPSSPTKGSLPVKTIGEACRQQAQALIEGLILYAHQCLELGQRAEDLFTSLFAKQSIVMARGNFPSFSQKHNSGGWEFQ